MLDPRHSWSTEQLVGFLAAVSACGDLVSARQIALERATEAVEADIGAIVEDGEVVAAIGFAAAETPVARLAAAAARPTATLDLPWGETCRCIALPLEVAGTTRLLLGRAGDPFAADEAGLLRGMARVLALACRTIALLDDERSLRASLRERQALAERLARIQRSIVHRTGLDETLEAIVEGARELLGDAVVGLRLVDPSDPAMMVLVASTGLTPEQREALRSTPAGDGAGGRAYAEDRVVVVDDYAGFPGRLTAFAPGSLTAALAAPVHENARPTGSLVVASSREGRRYSPTERDTLSAFAEHASLALTDARNFEEAMRQALSDPLTGLANRGLFLDHLSHALARSRRGAPRPSVLFLDIDNFKSINDTLGHAAGDDLLRQVARRLENCLRAQDTAARLGGDEFAVVLEAADGRGEPAAARILEAFRAPFLIRDRSMQVSVSIGIAADADAADELIQHADLAMYEAKAAGRARYAWYTPEMTRATTERLELEADLARALERGELFLQYQPIVRLATGEIAGAEALVRWRHPVRGLVSPADFIPLAEATELILPIGSWVLHEASRQAARWLALWPQLGISVNVSGVQLSDPGFAGDVAAAIETAKLPPRSLVLELTETVLMHDAEATIARLWEMRRLGAQIAVDDFGTGYSSLQYLLRFPLDIIKLARPFVDRIDGSEHEQAVGRAILELAAGLNLRVVGEGIERPGQLDRLAQMGCQLGQGFHLARPLDPAAFEAFLTLSRPVPRSQRS